MSGPAALAIAAGVLADVGLKSSLLLGLGFGASVLLRRRAAAARHAVWTCAFAALPVLPVLAAWRGASIALDAPWLVCAWGLGVVVSLIPLGRGLWALARLQRSASPDPARPGVRYSDAVASPITWGLWRPVVVLPSPAAGWPASAREAALSHEAAHIARRDWAVHLGVWLLCALLWFQPLAWAARRALSLEAERAADDVVLSKGLRPSAYASLLVSMAGAGTPRVALGAATSLVGRRVRAVLGDHPRSPRRWPAALLATIVFSLVAAGSGGWPLWSAPEASLTCQPGPLP